MLDKYVACLKTKKQKNQKPNKEQPYHFVIKLLLTIYVLEHYTTANSLNNNSTNRSPIFLEFILPELPGCLKQTKNNAPAKKAFLDLERDYGPCSHYGASFCRVQQRCTMNAQTKGPQKYHHPEHHTDPSSEQELHQAKRCTSVHWKRHVMLSVKSILNRHKSIYFSIWYWGNPAYQVIKTLDYSVEALSSVYTPAKPSVSLGRIHLI